MRIGVLSPVWYPVPPEGYGGTERIVSLLVEGLVAQGEDVTLFASGDSQTSAELVSVFAEAPSDRIGESFWELRHTLACLAWASDFDVIHDHSGLLGLALCGQQETPVVHTVHGSLEGDVGPLYARIAAAAPDIGLISISESQRAGWDELPWLATCHNAIEVDDYPLRTDHEGYLAFLGRMSPEKGAHRAIEIARAAGAELRIAAKCREPSEQKYFDRFVAPHLGQGVEYLGELRREECAELLGGARALLFPIEWEEPFGLVMVEALACGTPVIATRRGSVPEVLDHGRAGVIVDDYRDMVQALHDADALDPASLRRSVVERFSPERMVSSYLKAYERVLGLGELRPAELAA